MTRDRIASIIHAWVRAGDVAQKPALEGLARELEREMGGALTTLAEEIARLVAELEERAAQHLEADAQDMQEWADELTALTAARGPSR
jgi:hypothetical protein